MTLAFAGSDRRIAVAPLDLTVELDTELPCRQYDPDLWFADVPADLEVAKALCGSCPLKAECLAGAIERAEPWGVWGGEIFERGAVVPRKRPRGRPRKEDLARDAILRVEVANRTNVLVGSAERKLSGSAERKLSGSAERKLSRRGRRAEGCLISP